jgi:hypothetical protein
LWRAGHVRPEGEAVKSLRLIPAAVMVLFALIATAGAASAQPVQTSRTYVCTGGNIPAGTYGSIIVKGVCYMPAGTVVIKHDLIIGPKALLAAAGDRPDWGQRQGRQGRRPAARVLA